MISKYFNLFNLFLGTLITCPLYFRFFHIKPELIKVNMLLFIPGVKLIPLAFYAISFFLILTIRKINISFILPFIFINFILYILLINIPLNRICALLIPINLLYYISVLIRKKYIPLKYLTFGFLIGTFLTYTINIISAIINFPYNGNILGYEIYSFYVSYSAVSSLICVASFTSLICLKNLKKDWKIILFLLFVTSFIVLLLPQRRMALIDLGLIFLCSIFSTLISSYHRKTNLFILSSVPLVIISIVICLQYINRPLNTVTYGRLSSYIDAFQFLKSDNINSFLFGYKEGFADYSNLFLELFVRAGVVGTLGYILSILLVINFYFKTLNYSTSYKLDFNCKLPLFFIFCSVLFGNIANINISLPYYSINLVMVLISYQYLLSTIKIYKEGSPSDKS